MQFLLSRPLPLYFSSPAFFGIHAVTTRFAIRRFTVFYPPPCGNYLCKPALINKLS